MFYSLFDENCNFTKVLHGKSDTEILEERGLLNIDISTDSSEELDYAKSVFLLKVLDALLEPVDSPAIPQPTRLLPSPAAVCAAPNSSPRSSPTDNSVSPPLLPSGRQTACTHLPPLMTTVPRRSPSPLMSIAVPPPFIHQQQMIPPLLPRYHPYHSLRLVPLMAISIPPPHFCY